VVREVVTSHGLLMEHAKLVRIFLLLMKQVRDISVHFMAVVCSALTFRYFVPRLELLWSANPSGTCAKLCTTAASNNRDHAPRLLFAYANRYVQSFTS